MSTSALRQLLADVRDGKIDVDTGLRQLRDLPFMDLGHTRFDLHRPLRNGFPEVVFGEGKTPQQVADIFQQVGTHSNILATRVPASMAEHVRAVVPEANYHQSSRTLTLVRAPISYKQGEVAIVTAGTSDLPVAEEARITCEMFGTHCKIISDVGVAGLHRLLDKLPDIRISNAIIVVAGMEGALASIVGGLVKQPVVAVPTSVGYGAALSGLTALLGMLTSCAAGVTVVNIDNGFGAACAACKINNLMQGD